MSPTTRAAPASSLSLPSRKFYHLRHGYQCWPHHRQYQHHHHDHIMVQFFQFSPLASSRFCPGSSTYDTPHPVLLLTMRANLPEKFHIPATQVTRAYLSFLTCTIGFSASFFASSRPVRHSSCSKSIIPPWIWAFFAIYLLWRTILSITRCFRQLFITIIHAAKSFFTQERNQQW